MAFYPDDLVNEVFSQNDIVDYVSQYVRLKKAGKDYSGLCPFHKEKSPSFHVSREKQLFHCFGCGASGNLVQFVMRSESLDFVEALKLLAQRVGIDLPEDNKNVSNETYELKKKIYEINKLCARLYYDTLVKTPDGKIALSYFSDRKILPKTITSFGLGFAPDSYTYVLDFLKKKGYTEDEIMASGLIVNRDGKLYDKFRNRVIFPIMDLRGNVIGFGGRIMGQAKETNGFKIPKYLNSPETPVFDKGKNLFSLNLAKKQGAYSIILVEGYMDVITVYQAGVTNVCATLGTALTENQAKLLLKYCNEILLCYDSDEAGQKATIRAIEIINSAGGASRVINLKKSKDPDEYIKAYGTTSFLEAIKEAVASTRYRLDIIRTKYSLDSPEGKSLFIKEAVEILSGLQNAVEVDAYINELAVEVGVNKDTIYAEFKKYLANSKRSDTSDRILEKRTDEYELPVITKEEERLVNAEKVLIYLMVENKKYIDEVMKTFSADDFSTDINKRLVSLIYEAKKAGKPIEASYLLNEFSGAEVSYVSNIFYKMEEFKNIENSIKELILNIKIEKINYKLSRTKDAKEAQNLIEELKKLKSN